jgi:lactoylglutathione lyase
MINGLFETHIHVANLERAMGFYSDVLGLKLGRLEADRRVALYWVGGVGEAMLGLWEKPAEQITLQHFAFRSLLKDMVHATEFLRDRGIPARNFLDDGTDRPMVFGWMPAVALYFSNPDGHSLELIAMLPDRARPEIGVVSLEEWERLQRTSSEGA